MRCSQFWVNIHVSVIHSDLESLLFHTCGLAETQIWNAVTYDYPN